MNESRTPRTWNEGWRCAECCTGDRCDDPSHYDRPKCPHCHGTGSAIWNMYSKEDEAKKLKSALTAALARAEKAEAELERVRKDAARYEWLRSQHESDTACAFSVFAPDGDKESEAVMYPVGSMPGELDAAIDAAMKEHGNG